MPKIEAAVITSKGNVRSTNEDNFYFNGMFMRNNNEPDPFLLTTSNTDNKFLFAVCDGMGGEQCGEYASFVAVEQLHHLYMHQIKSLGHISDFKRKLDDYIESTNGVIFEYAVQLNKKIGTTFAAIAFYNDKVLALNVGDSRVYMLRDSKLTQLTTDHTEAQRLIRLGVLDNNTAKHHKSRSVLTRHFGSDPANGVMEADYSQQLAILNGDTFLICSDGVSNSLTDEQLEECMSGVYSELICKKLIALADGNDNVTALVVKIVDNTY